MTARHIPEVLHARQEIVAPPAPRACEDRSFELPPALHIAMAGLFLGFVSVLSLALMGPELVVPYVVFIAFIVAFFVVPALWTAIAPAESQTRPLSWSRFVEQGIETATGRETAGSATVLVLLLPLLIFCWALAVVGVVAFLV